MAVNGKVYHINGIIKGAWSNDKKTGHFRVSSLNLQDNLFEYDCSAILRTESDLRVNLKTISGMAREFIIILMDLT